ncbi:TolC family protein [bacterium]|nr:TolC family protein [bacterium]
MKSSMNIKAAWILLIWILAIGKANAFAEGDHLTLQEAARIMAENNPQLSQRALESQSAKAEYDTSLGSYYPTIDFVQSVSHSNNPVYVFGSLLNQQRFTAANFDIDSLNNPDALTDHVSSFQLGWLLYDFGGRENRNAAAKTGMHIYELQYQAEQNRLIQELIARYYAVSLAHQRIEAAQDTLKSAQSRRDQSKERVDAGLSVESDLLSSEVFLSRARQQLIDAENQANYAVAALNEILGNFQLSWKTTSPMTELSIPPNPLSYWIDLMNKNRVELQIADAGKDIAENKVAMTNSKFLPSIQGWSNYEWHGDSLDYTGNNWGVGIELKWNLFRGFSDKSSLSSAKYESQKAGERYRETQNALRLQVESAYYRLQAAKEKYAVSESILKQAEENRRIYAERYASGLVSVQDSLQADASFSESRTMHLQNLFEVHTAYAALLASSGRAQDILQSNKVIYEQ